MKRVCSPGYHHNRFVVTQPLALMMYGCRLLEPMNQSQRVLNKVSKELNITGYK